MGGEAGAIGRLRLRRQVAALNNPGPAVDREGPGLGGLTRRGQKGGDGGCGEDQGFHAATPKGEIASSGQARRQGKSLTACRRDRLRVTTTGWPA